MPVETTGYSPRNITNPRFSKNAAGKLLGTNMQTLQATVQARAMASDDGHVLAARSAQASNATNDIGFVKSCADTCKPMNMCPKASYKLAEVKAACYDNILTRCKQGQAGWGGQWRVGPGADKTCEARAQQICKCGDKPACRGNWGSSRDETPQWYAGDGGTVSELACTVPRMDQDEPIADHASLHDARTS